MLKKTRGGRIGEQEALVAAQEALVAGALSKNALIKDEREADNALIMHQMDTAKAMLPSVEPVIRMLHAPGHVAVADHKLDIPPESVAPLGHQAAPTADTEVEQGTTTSANCNLSAEYMYAHMPAQLEQMYSTDHDGLVISHEGIIDVKPAPTADGEIVESEQGAADPHLVGTMTANANAPTSAEFAQLQADHEQMKLMFLQVQAQLMEYQPLITSTNDISGIHDSSIVLPTTAAGSSGEIQSSSSNEETGIGKTPTPLALNLPELSPVGGTCMSVRVYHPSVVHQRRSNVQACFI